MEERDGNRAGDAADEVSGERIELKQIDLIEYHSGEPAIEPTV